MNPKRRIINEGLLTLIGEILQILVFPFHQYHIYYNVSAQQIVLPRFSLD